MNRWHHAVMAILGVFLLVLLPAASPTHSQTPPSPEDIIQGAWRKANASSTYRFRTDLQQTLYPALRLSNAGSTTVQDQFYVEGQIAPPSEDFSLRLWRGGESPESAYEIRMADGQASGRIAGGEWQALDANTELYAPGGDPLSYLNAIKNAHPITNTTSQPSHSPSTIHNSQFPIPHSPFLIPHSKFSFDLDSPAFANMMREQLQRQLIESGQLPAGMSVEIADIYRDMTAQGELWVDEDGLPLRLKLSLAFPPEADGSQVKADIQTDFFDFAPALAEEQAAQALLGALHLDGDIIGPGLVVGLLALALTMLAADHRPARRRLAYVAVVSVVVLSMLVTPLLQSVQAAAFYDRQAEQRAAYEAQRAEHLARAEQQAATSAWDPTVNPLESASPTAPSIPETGMESNTSLSAPAPDFVSACSIPGGG